LLAGFLGKARDEKGGCAAKPTEAPYVPWLPGTRFLTTQDA